MNFILSGVTGTIGFYLIKEILRGNNSCTVILNPNSQRNTHIEAIQNISIFYSDLSKISKLELKNDFDVFIHMAWDGGKLRDDYSINLDSVKYSIDAFELAVKLKCHTFISTGSQAECGPTDNIITDSFNCNPISMFGISKLTAYRMLKEKAKYNNLRFIWLRILSVYGRYDRNDSLISILIKNLLNKKLTVLSSCNQYWDYVHSYDVATALLTLSYESKYQGVYVIGNQERKKLKNYIDIILEQFPKIYEDYITYNNNIKTQNLRCDCTKLNSTGWKPKIKFDNGITDLIKFYSDERKQN